MQCMNIYFHGQIYRGPTFLLELPIILINRFYSIDNFQGMEEMQFEICGYPFIWGRRNTHES
jgi:hypothetical protein